MAVKLLKVAKRGQDRLIAELSNARASRALQPTGHYEIELDIFFGHQYTETDNKHVMHGTVHEFEDLVRQIAYNATSYEGNVGTGFRHIPTDERVQYATAWLRTLADNMAADHAILVHLSQRKKQLACVQPLLRMLRLWQSTSNDGDWINGVSVEELCTEATEYTGFTYAGTDTERVRDAIYGLTKWVDDTTTYIETHTKHKD